MFKSKKNDNIFESEYLKKDYGHDVSEDQMRDLGEFEGENPPNNDENKNIVGKSNLVFIFITGIFLVTIFVIFLTMIL